MEMSETLATTITEGNVHRNDLVEYADVSVMNFRVLDEMNIAEFAKPRPGVFCLAVSDLHDSLRVQPPYYYGKTDDMRAALAAQLRPADAELARYARLGARWFRVVYAAAEDLDAALATLRARYGMAEPGPDMQGPEQHN
jgi:hypothetical protein